MKKKLLVGLATGSILAGMVGLANATLTYDANVTPSVKFGTGNANGFFVVSTGDDVEVGLRAKVPYQGVYNSNGNGIYSMSSGDHPKWGAPGAAWNFEFSVNVNTDGLNSETFTDFTTLLSIDMDPSIGQAWTTFDPITTFTDNFIENNSLAQNSMNIGWLGMPVDTSIAATYDFKLGVYDLAGNNLAETFMTVEVDGGAAPVPEPTTMLLFTTGLAGLVGTRVRKKKKNNHKTVA